MQVSKISPHLNTIELLIIFKVFGNPAFSIYVLLFLMLNSIFEKVANQSLAKFNTYNKLQTKANKVSKVFPW